jgi:hypothetical protein
MTKLKVEGAADTAGGGLTLNVTGIVWGEFGMKGALTVIEPAYVPGSRFVTFALTCTVALPEPEPGVTCSQLPPALVLVWTLQLMVPPFWFAIVRDCGDGSVPWIVEKLSVEGLRTRSGPGRRTNRWAVKLAEGFGTCGELIVTVPT